MLSYRLLRAAQPRSSSFICLLCSARGHDAQYQIRLYSATPHRYDDIAAAITDAQSSVKDRRIVDSLPTPVESANTKKNARRSKSKNTRPGVGADALSTQNGDTEARNAPSGAGRARESQRNRRRAARARPVRRVQSARGLPPEPELVRRVKSAEELQPEPEQPEPTMTLKEAMSRKLLGKKRRKKTTEQTELPDLKIEQLSPEELEFKPIEVEMPPVPMLAHGLDRVLFNPGVYRLQDPRSRIYNFDPYLEKIMPVAEFDFDALSAYKTSSKDESLLAMTKNLGMKFTGSTSSMSGALTHFHYLLSNWRKLRQDHLSQQFPDPSDNFSRIQRSPAGIFLRWKDGVYAIDADKQYDKTNIMSWLGHTLEKLLTNPADTFERYRRSSPEKTPYQGEERKSYHYSQLGRVLMRSQLDAYDPRLPGSGVFDLKTRAVVSIRMDHEEYEKGSGYQLRFGQGEWESFEREYYDMTRATMLKYSLQVRMGRMDGIFVAYHNVERIFGFQYISLSEMDQILHGQSDTCLGDQEFKLSIHLLTEMLERATQKFPNKSIRLHFDTRETQIPFMYIFAEAVSEEEAEVIQNTNAAQMKEFERSIIGLNRDDPDMQAEWQEIQERVYEEVVEDQLQERDESEDEGIGSQDEDMILGQRQAGGEAIDTGGSLSRVNPSHKATVEERSGEANTPTPSKPEMVPDVDRASNPSEDVDGTFTDKQGSPGEPISNNPGNVMGWTLTIRNRVNGQYVPRPESLGPFDSWSIEYYIQELEPNSGMQLYQALKQRRAKAHAPKEGDSSMKTFRQIIHSFSKKGRQWRERQDKIDEQIGKRMYRPLGPGSANVIPDEGPWVSEKAMSDIGNNGSCGADK